MAEIQSFLRSWSDFTRGKNAICFDWLDVDSIIWTEMMANSEHFLVQSMTPHDIAWHPTFNEFFPTFGRQRDMFGVPSFHYVVVGPA